MRSKFLSFILIFFIFGCSSRTTVLKERNLIIKNHLDRTEQEPPLVVDIVYARSLKDRGWDLEDYRIETDDVLEVSVWQVEKLNRTLVVRPDGEISYPLIGELKAEGKTIKELRDEITKKLVKYVKQPEVSINIKKFGGKRAIVMKEIGGGGVLRFTTPITIVEAVAMSGGYNNDINLKKVYIVREPNVKKGHVKVIVVNIQNLLRKADIRENVYVKSKDVIFLARGWLSSVNNFKKEVNKLVDFDVKLKPFGDKVPGVMKEMPTFTAW